MPESQLDRDERRSSTAREQLVIVRLERLSKTVGNAKAASRRPLLKLQIYREIGAGEAIRTLDPNLGKVVLYP